MTEEKVSADSRDSDGRASRRARWSPRTRPPARPRLPPQPRRCHTDSPPRGQPPSLRPDRPRSPAQPPSRTSRASPLSSPPKTPCPLSAWTWTARRTSSPSNGRGRATTSSRTRSAPKSGSTPLITATSPPRTNGDSASRPDLVEHPLDPGKLLARIGFQAPHLPDDRPLNVTLVLDASGSMAERQPRRHCPRRRRRPSARACVPKTASPSSTSPQGRGS